MTHFLVIFHDPCSLKLQYVALKRNKHYSKNQQLKLLFYITPIISVKLKEQCADFSGI